MKKLLLSLLLIFGGTLQSAEGQIAGAELLFFALTGRDVAGVNLLCTQSGVSPDSQFQGQPAIVFAALQDVAHDDAHDDAHGTALTEALIALGADVTAVEPVNGWTALHIAAAADNVPLVRALMIAGADPFAVAHDGEQTQDASGTQRVKDEIRRIMEGYDAAVEKIETSYKTPECPVCISESQWPVATQCAHVFCEQCFHTSMHHDSRCPLCRAHQPQAQRVLHKGELDTVAALMSMSESSDSASEMEVE